MPRHAKALIALLPAALLGACGQSQDSAADTSASATPVATATGSATPLAVTTYDCLPAQRLSASYDNTGATPTATLTLDGTSYLLTNVPSADGAKYSTDQGRSAGKTLVWWTKGQDGTLYEGKVGGTAADETKVAECSPSTSG